MNYSVEKILKLRKDAATSHSKWRIEAREDFEFRDGEQWSSDDKAKLEEQGRPIVTFNRIGPIIDSVKGQELNNRQEIRYLPRTKEDAGINEVYSSTAKWVRDECDAEDEESDAYDDSITTGMGWIEWYVDYASDPDGKICAIRVPPLEMRWDPSSRRKNLSDRRWDLREKWMTKEAIKEKWPSADLAAESIDSTDHEYIQPHDATESWKYENYSSDVWTTEKKDKYLVVHFQWRYEEPYYRVGDPETGRVLEFTEKKFNRIKKQVENSGIVYAKLTRWKYKEKFLVGKELLEERDVPVNCFTRIPITAKREESTGMWFGIVRAMKDPQRWANKFFSQIMHIFNANPKGGVVLEKDAVADHLDFENKWADPSGVVYVEDGAITGGKIKDKPMTGYPSSLDKMLNFAISSIRDVSGMNVEMMGLAEREQSGVLEQERKKAALTILAPFANSLRHHRKESGRVLLNFMRKYIPEGKMIRILEKGQEKYVPFVKDDDTVKYDVIVDTAPSSPNLKQEVWGTLQNILPGLMKAGVPIPPALLDFSPLPESVVAEWKEYIEQRSQISPEQVQQLNQQVQKLTEENKKLSDKKQESAANLQLKRDEMMMEHQLEKERLLMEARNKEMEIALKKEISAEELRIKIAEIQAHYDVEIQKIKEQTAAEREKHGMNAAVQRHKAQLDVAAKKEIARIEKGGEVEMLGSRELDVMSKILEEVMQSNIEIKKSSESVIKVLEDKIDSDSKMRKEILKEVKKL